MLDKQSNIRVKQVSYFSCFLGFITSMRKLLKYKRVTKLKCGGDLSMLLNELAFNISRLIQYYFESIYNFINSYHYEYYVLMRNECEMVDFIINCAFILGIFAAIRGKKEQIKAFRNLGFMLIVLCSIYIVPSFLSGFYQGFMDGIMGN